MFNKAFLRKRVSSAAYGVTIEVKRHSTSPDGVSLTVHYEAKTKQSCFQLCLHATPSRPTGRGGELLLHMPQALVWKPPNHRDKLNENATDAIKARLAAGLSVLGYEARFIPADESRGKLLHHRGRDFEIIDRLAYEYVLEYHRHFDSELCICLVPGMLPEKLALPLRVTLWVSDADCHVNGHPRTLSQDEITTMMSDISESSQRLRNVVLTFLGAGGRELHVQRV